MIQDTNTSLVKIEGVTKKEDTEVGDARLLLWRGVHEERR
jgi:ribosomal protein L35AE/L33A